MMQPLEVAALAFPIPDGVIDKIQLRETAKILDREYRRENRLQPGVFAFRGQQIHLQKALIREPLDLDQVRDLDRTLDLRKVQALALPDGTISIAMISVSIFHSLTSRYPKGSGRDARRTHFRHRSGLDTVEAQIPDNAASYEFLCAHAGARGRAIAFLFNFYFGARILKLLLDGGGFVLVHAFLDRLRRTIDEVLGFLQAQASHFANSLNDIDLVGSHFGEHNRELRLL